MQKLNNPTVNCNFIRRTLFTVGRFNLLSHKNKETFYTFFFFKKPFFFCNYDDSVVTNLAN